MKELPYFPVQRMDGKELFRLEGTVKTFDLSSFWQWAYSDLLGNTARGVIAEYLVAVAIGLEANPIRNDWGPYDLVTQSLHRLEVKSAAWLQRWHQRDFSRIEFSVRKTKAWNAETGESDDEARRHSHAYVFALLDHKDPKTINPMDSSQWLFYVLPTETIESRQRSQTLITLNSLHDLVQPVHYLELAGKIAKVCESIDLSIQAL